MTTELNAFIEKLPKVELHLHIEGSLEPELMFALAKRNNVDIPFASVEEVKQAYNFSNLQDFLDIYYQGMSVLQTEQDFYDLTWAYIEKCRQDNVMHTEIFFDPQGHTDRGVAFETVINGISRALDDAKTKFDISSNIIMCFLRHLSEDDALKTLEQAMPYKNKIIGVGLDSSEVGHPPSKFANVFKQARDAGFKIVAHAGEEGPPEYIYEALDLLNVDRVDHGNRSLENNELITRLANEKMALTVCPLSNLKLCVVKDMKDHPLKKMLDLGLKATINSDDPSYFGGYMNDNFNAVTEALNLTKENLLQITENSIDASFLSDDAKETLKEQVKAYAGS